MTNHLHPATETAAPARPTTPGTATTQNEVLTCIERRIRTAAGADQVADHVAAEIEAMCRRGLSAGPGAAPALLHRAGMFIADTVRTDVESFAAGQRDSDGDWQPVAHSVRPDELETIESGCALVRDIEATAGPLPIQLKWLRAVIDSPDWLLKLPRGVVAGRA